MTEPNADPTIVDPGEIDFDHEELRTFWDVARVRAKLNAAPTYFGPTTLESVPPPAWAWGDASESDAFVEQVLAEDGGSTTADEADYGGDLPSAGTLSILCDGSGVPRALLEVTDVVIAGGEVVESFRVVHRA